MLAQTICALAKLVGGDGFTRDQVVRVISHVPSAHDDPGEPNAGDVQGERSPAPVPPSDASDLSDLPTLTEEDEQRLDAALRDENPGESLRRILRDIDADEGRGGPVTAFVADGGRRGGWAPVTEWLRNPTHK